MPEAIYVEPFPKAKRGDEFKNFASTEPTHTVALTGQSLVVARLRLLLVEPLWKLERLRF